MLPETNGLHDLSDDRAQDNQADTDPEQEPVTKNDREGAEGEGDRDDDDGRPRGRDRDQTSVIPRYPLHTGRSKRVRDRGEALCWAPR